jgi:hypothetical protein
MIHHYHGAPIWGDKGSVHKIAVNGAGAFVSYARPNQLSASFTYAASVAIDNGAFSAWKSGLRINWLDFYRWLTPHYYHSKMTFFVIPDVITGNEYDNDNLIKSMPRQFIEKAVPVWHLHESIDRLIELCKCWPRVCFGSSGQYAQIRTAVWHARMREAFLTIHSHGLSPQIHGLRMLDGRVLGNYPLTTADSTNLACNVPKYKVKYPELTKAVMMADYAVGLSARDLNVLILKQRCAILKGAIESVTPPTLREYIESL